jgi:DNA-binding XRE family transcriptional regulator
VGDDRGMIKLKRELERGADNQVSLKTARIMSGFTTKESAQYAEITEKTLSKYERRPSNTPLKIAIKLQKLYNVPIDMIYFI